jgi:hypothetical protein
MMVGPSKSVVGKLALNPLKLLVLRVQVVSVEEKLIHN